MARWDAAPLHGQAGDTPDSRIPGNLLARGRGTRRNLQANQAVNQMATQEAAHTQPPARVAEDPSAAAFGLDPVVAMVEGMAPAWP